MGFLSRVFGKTLDDSFDRGLKLFHKERYDEAMIELAKTLEENPDHTEAIEVLYVMLRSTAH